MWEAASNAPQSIQRYTWNNRDRERERDREKVPEEKKKDER